MTRHFFSDMGVMLGRSMRHIFRSLDTIITVTIMPIAFMLLFVYVFGGAIQTGTDNYVNYLLPGILLMAIVVVIDASAAYLQRQGLDTLADGAALHGADLGDVGHSARPADQLIVVEQRDDDLLIRGVAAADVGVVVEKDVARADADVGLVVVVDHPLDRPRHGAHVHHQARRQAYRVALRRVQPQHRLAHLAHLRRCGHLAGQLAGGHQDEGLALAAGGVEALQHG